MDTPLPILLLGFVLGLKHALDTDHLIAVSTIVSEHKKVLSSAITGALWGLGHTASLLVVGVIVIALHLSIPSTIALAMEFGVALMLVALGLHVLYKLFRGGELHAHSHSHEGIVHAHPHIHAKERKYIHSHHALPFNLLPQNVISHLQKGKRSVFIGMVHGLAGSAALMLIVLATIPSPTLGLAYIGIFGIGSVGGMMVMSTLIGLPFALTTRASGKMNYIIRGTSGLLSIGFGLFYAWQLGVVEGLLF